MDKSMVVRYHEDHPSTSNRDKGLKRNFLYEQVIRLLPEFPLLLLLLLRIEPPYHQVEVEVDGTGSDRIARKWG